MYRRAPPLGAWRFSEYDRREGLTALCAVRLSCYLVGLIDKLHGAVAIVHTHGRKCTALPVLQSLAQYQHIGRLWRDGWQRFCPLRHDDPQDVVLEPQHCIPG